MKPVIRVLQWNMGLSFETNPTRISSRLEVLKNLIIAHSPDIITLQETDAKVIALLKGMKLTLSDHATKTRSFITAHTNKWINPAGSAFSRRARSLGIYLDEHNGSHKLAVWNFHLRSRKSSQDGTIETEFTNEINYPVRSLRQQPAYQARNELLCGDFNLEPYSRAFCRFEVTRCHSWASSSRIRRDPNNWPLFNPCWSILGMQNEPLGTFFATDQDDRPWYVPDQILISPKLGSWSNLAIIHEINSLPLYKGPRRIPDKDVGSDHFPLLLDVGETLPSSSHGLSSDCA